MKKIALMALCAFLALPLSSSFASALTVPEKLVYNVSWTGVTAAKAVHEVTAQGNDLHIVSTTRSTGWVDTFFTIDDRLESVVARGEGNDRFGRPKSFHQNIKEGKRRVVKDTQFDPRALKVETTDRLKKTGNTDSISSKTFDTLSSIYYVRSLDLVPGKSVYFDIYDTKRLWRTEVKVLRREEVTTPVGTFKTLVVKPIPRADGAKPKTGDLTVWVTDDAQRIPVKIVTKVKVGKITATLVGGSYWN